MQSILCLLIFFDGMNPTFLIPIGSKLHSILLTASSSDAIRFFLSAMFEFSILYRFRDNFRFEIIFIFIASKVEAYGQEEQFSGRNLLLEIPTSEALCFGSSKYKALKIKKENIAAVDQRLGG